jgi:hypothetical protein
MFRCPNTRSAKAHTSFAEVSGLSQVLKGQLDLQHRGRGHRFERLLVLVFGGTGQESLDFGEQIEGLHPVTPFRGVEVIRHHFNDRPPEAARQPIHLLLLVGREGDDLRRQVRGGLAGGNFVAGGGAQAQRNHEQRGQEDAENRFHFWLECWL